MKNQTPKTAQTTKNDISNKPSLPRILPSLQASTPMNIQHKNPISPCPDRTGLNPRNTRVSYPIHSPILSNQMNDSQADDELISKNVSFSETIIDNPATAIVQQQVRGNVVKMLVILPSDRQRLITFDIPTDCTVQDLLKYANISITSQTVISLVTNPILDINYIVTNKKSIIITADTTSDPPRSLELVATPLEDSDNSPRTPHEEPRFIEDRLAACPYCDTNSIDFNRCLTCRNKLPSDVEQVRMIMSEQQKQEAMIKIKNYYKKNCEQQQKHNIERDCAAKRSRSVSPKEKHKKNNTLTKSHMYVTSDIPEKISSKEPIITNNNPLISDGLRMQTSFVCRSIWIGSYKYTLSDKIILNQRGLTLVAPMLQYNNRLTTIHVRFIDIIKVLIYFSKQMPVLFFYVTPECSAIICEVLGMQQSEEPYFDPAGKDHTHKRITLLPEQITEESEYILKKLFTPGVNFEELNTKEANNIFASAIPKSPTQTKCSIERQNMLKPVNSNTTNACRQPSCALKSITVFLPSPANRNIVTNTEDNGHFQIIMRQS